MIIEISPTFSRTLMHSQRNLTVRTGDPGYSDLFQLIYLLVSGSKTTELLNGVCWDTSVEESVFIVESQVMLRRAIENQHGI